MIEAYSFGKMTVNGTTHTGDLKILQGKVLANWWRKTGHEVIEDDITDILEAKPDILIIGKGEPGEMNSGKALRKRLKHSEIELIEEKTSEAIKTFNRFYEEGKNVAAGFHLTC